MHHLRLEIDYILAKAHQHLRRGLPPDAAINVGLAREADRRVKVPALGNRVAHEDHAVFACCRWTQFQIFLLEAAKPAEIDQQPCVKLPLPRRNRSRGRRCFALGRGRSLCRKGGHE
jgi:hypothetical protein